MPSTPVNREEAGSSREWIVVGGEFYTNIQTPTEFLFVSPSPAEIARHSNTRQRVREINQQPEMAAMISTAIARAAIAVESDNTPPPKPRRARKAQVEKASERLRAKLQQRVQSADSEP